MGLLSGFTSNSIDNWFNGTRQCEDRMESWFSGQPSIMEAGKQACKGGDPGRYIKPESFLNEYNASLEQSFNSAESRSDTQKAINQRDKAIQVAKYFGVTLVLVFIIVLTVRYIKKGKK